MSCTRLSRRPIPLAHTAPPSVNQPLSRRSALAYLAMAMVNRSLPAVTTSLGVLATPVVGVVSSMVVLDEPFSMALLVALTMIVGGIALGTVGGRNTQTA